MKIYLPALFALVGALTLGCANPNESDKSAEELALRKKELELKEREIALKEKAMAEKTLSSEPITTSPPKKRTDEPIADATNDFYILNVAAVKTRTEAQKQAENLRRQGYDADYLWIPDYASLSNAPYFSVYIGPYFSQQECEVATENYRMSEPSAYGLLVSQDNIRVQINGIGKVKITDPYFPK